MSVLFRYTVRTLEKNHTRTLVTLIGIALSMALLTAVIEGCYSGVQFLIRGTEADVGRFHGSFMNLDPEEAKQVSALEGVTETAALTEVGWAEIGSQNAQKPYLLIVSGDDHFEELVAIRLMEGRMAENDTEIVLPYHLETNGGVAYQIGDVIELETGKRTVGDIRVHMDTPFQEGDGIVEKERRTYTVVGIMKRFAWAVEYGNSPGYMALTKGGSGDAKNVYFRLKSAGDYQKFEQEMYFENQRIHPNTDLLVYSGSLSDGGLKTFLYGFTGILVFLIVFGSVALIYNSFSISVGERTRQFGILRSVGATRRQIRAMVFMEALILSGLAIPVGMLVGCAGIGLTLYLLRDVFQSMLDAGNPVRMQLVLHPGVLGIAALAGLLTVMISAIVPAMRALRVAPISAIRESQDVRIRPRAVRTSALTEKLFGFEGAMARKNFKRDRRRYRATVWSLFLSIVLYISASSFTSYLKSSASDLQAADTPSDVRVMLNAETLEELYGHFETILSHPDVREASLMIYCGSTIEVPEDALSDSFFTYHPEEERQDGSGMRSIYAPVILIDDTEFDRYARECGTSREKLTEGGSVNGILMNAVSTYTYEEDRRKFYSYELLKKTAVPVHVVLNRMQSADSYEFTDLTIGVLTDRLPLSPLGKGMNFLIFPMSEAGTLAADGNIGRYQQVISAHSSEHARLTDELTKEFRERGVSDVSVQDDAESREFVRMAILAINVFSYGFIILISLIAVANVFNTISTNIFLRRREFAMLKSVGLSERGLKKMLNYECLICGLKGLFLGLPAAVMMTYVIYRVTNSSFEIGFYIPWESVAIAVASVFFVVFSTMVYARKKIAGDNPIDALKLETL